MVVVENLMIEEAEVILVLAWAESCVLIFEWCRIRRLDLFKLIDAASTSQHRGEF